MSIVVPGTYADSFDHAFDPKGRITVPSEWRGEGFETRLHIFASRSKVLYVYPASWLAKKQADADERKLKVADPQRKALERLSAGSQAVELDTQGRIMVKEKYREAVGLGKEAKLVGCFDHFEVWDKAVYEETNSGLIMFEDATEGAGV